MTNIQDLLAKLKSNKNRDALAEISAEKHYYDNENEDPIIMDMYRKNAIKDFNDGWNARTKDVELLVALCEKLWLQRNHAISSYRLSKGFSVGDVEHIADEQDKELLTIAEEFYPTQRVNQEYPADGVKENK